MNQTNHCQCPYCSGRNQFKIDDFLFSELESRNVVLFIGAGVSTENRNSAPHTLYTEIESALDTRDSGLNFPDLVQLLCDRPDGRFAFMKMVQARFDYIKKFSTLRHVSTRFFEELSTMPYFNTFITTNWDRSLEEVCHSKPFVYDEDMRFWSVPPRRVLKIHGTIDDYSSIVASRRDYDECSKRLQTSLIGGKLKELLNTSTCIFIGYSLQDDDFSDIYRFVQNAQGKFHKTHYFVSPLEEHIVLPNICQIKTDGTYFLEVIKEHMCSNYCFLDDGVYEAAEDELYELLDEHQSLWDEIDVREFPQIIMAGMYQDGLIHAYQMARDVRGTGRFSDVHNLRARIHSYQDKIDYYRKKRAYSDVSYFQGFQNVLIGFASSLDGDEFYTPPRYFYPKVGEMNFEEFREKLEDLPVIHKAAFRECEKWISRWPSEETFVPQHSPWG